MFRWYSLLVTSLHRSDRPDLDRRGSGLATLSDLFAFRSAPRFDTVSSLLLVGVMTFRNFMRSWAVQAVDEVYQNSAVDLIRSLNYDRTQSISTYHSPATYL